MGSTSPTLRWEIAADGALVANGVRVTADNGWLNVTLPNEVARVGAPNVVTLRLVLARDARGAAMLTAHEITCGARRYTSLDSLAHDQPDPWIAALGTAIDDEIARRVERGMRLHANGAHGHKRTGRGGSESP